MEGLVILFVLLFIAMALFVRECRLDDARYREEERLGNLRMLREFKKLYEKQSRDTSEIEKGIRELERGR